MKMIVILLLAVLLVSCSGEAYFPDVRSVEGQTGTVTITFELPTIIDIPWEVQDGQTAIRRGDTWYLYDTDGNLIDQR